MKTKIIVICLVVLVAGFAFYKHLQNKKEKEKVTELNTQIELNEQMIKQLKETPPKVVQKTVYIPAQNTTTSKVIESASKFPVFDISAYVNAPKGTRIMSAAGAKEMAGWFKHVRVKKDLRGALEYLKNKMIVLGMDSRAKSGQVASAYFTLYGSDLRWDMNKYFMADKYPFYKEMISFVESKPNYLTFSFGLNPTPYEELVIVENPNVETPNF